MQNDDFNIDVVIAEITAFAENMHAKNQHKKKVCLRCMMIIPLVFMVLMFTMDTAKVVYLLLWVISLFIFCAYLLLIILTTSSQESSMSSILRLRKNRLILLLQTVSKHF